MKAGSIRPVESDTTVKAPERKTYVLFGFEKADEKHVGYLRIRKDGCRGMFGVYDVVDYASDATRFDAFNYDGRERFSPPEKVLDFIGGEEELSGWKFHLVGYSEKPGKGEA